MKKLLVRTSFVSSVEVHDDATQEEILTATGFKLFQQIQHELSENLDEIVEDTELTIITDETPKALIEQECIVEVEFTDINGVTRTAKVMHNGDDDCWDGLGNGLNEDFEEDIAFDFNTFDKRVYGDVAKDDISDASFGLTVYQCTQKDDNGVWTNDNNIDVESKILKITVK